MRFFTLRTLAFSLATAFLLAGASCRREAYSPEKAAFAQGKDLIMEEIEAFRTETRGLYNNRKFDQLEARAADVRTNKARFGNGDWKLSHVYSSLACREDEPESMWKLHEEIHHDWERKFPESVTARVAHAGFLTDYAWHARGTGYANEVTEEHWQLFRNRLKSARTILDESEKLTPKCPEWWQVQMTVALGQSWSKEDFAKLFEEAKSVEPKYFTHDLAQAKFLLPRWHGEPGDWEAAAEKEIARPGGLEDEGYARVVSEVRGYYDDLFSESNASWRKARKGFEQMRKEYPKSEEILNEYARIACAANDQATAKKLFNEIGDKVIIHVWGGRQRFAQMKRWAKN